MPCTIHRWLGATDHLRKYFPLLSTVPDLRLGGGPVKKEEDGAQMYMYDSKGM